MVLVVIDKYINYFSLFFFLILEINSEKVSNSNDIYFTNQRDEASPETPNQVSGEQDEIPTEEHQKLKDVQKSESDEQESQSNTETEPD